MRIYDKLECKYCGHEHPSEFCNSLAAIRERGYARPVKYRSFNPRTYGSAVSRGAAKGRAKTIQRWLQAKMIKEAQAKLARRKKKNGK